MQKMQMTIRSFSAVTVLPPLYRLHKQSIVHQWITLSQIPKDSSHDQVLDLLSLIGRVKRLELEHSVGKEFTGKCYALMDKSGAEKAMRLNDSCFRGAKLKVLMDADSNKIQRY
jgi:hypothetical protein